MVTELTYPIVGDEQSSCKGLCRVMRTVWLAEGSQRGREGKVNEPRKERDFCRACYLKRNGEVFFLSFFFFSLLSRDTPKISQRCGGWENIAMIGIEQKYVS